MFLEPHAADNNIPIINTIHIMIHKLSYPAAFILLVIYTPRRYNKYITQQTTPNIIIHNKILFKEFLARCGFSCIFNPQFTPKATAIAIHT
jgi:hypothetical protein